MNKKLCALYVVIFSLTMLACSNDSVSGSSEDPNVLTAEKSSSSSTQQPSSSSVSLVLCKASGGWGCSIGGIGDLWESGDLKVKTNIYAEKTFKFGEHAGDLFFETDSIKGGKTQIIWYHNHSVASEFRSGSLNALVFLDKNEMIETPFFDIGFYVAGFDSNGFALSADISNWNGICILAQYGSVVNDDRNSGSIELSLILDLGNSINTKIGYALPSVKISPKGETQCYEWKQFKQPNLGTEHEVISGEDAAKNVERIVFHFQSMVAQDTLYFDFLAIGTNRD